MHLRHASVVREGLRILLLLLLLCTAGIHTMLHKRSRRRVRSIPLRSRRRHAAGIGIVRHDNRNWRATTTSGARLTNPCRSHKMKFKPFAAVCVWTALATEPDG